MLVQKYASQKKLAVRMDEEAVRYFSGLYQSFLKKGATTRFCPFVVMMVALKQIGCEQDAIEKLCIKGEFTSWKELVDAQYSFTEYRELGISLQQARLLAEKIRRPVALIVKTVPLDKIDRSLLYSISAV